MESAYFNNGNILTLRGWNFADLKRELWLWTWWWQSARWKC